MRAPSLPLFLVALCGLFGAVQQVSAQLPSRTEILLDRYDEDRANGLMRLNANYIASFKQAMVTATRAGDLEAATSLKEKIEALEAENVALEQALAAADEEEPEDLGENPLLGKTVHFPHNRDQDFTARLVFKENGIVNWIGLGNAKVEWEYEQIKPPYGYRAWMKGRDAGGGSRIILDPEGRTALVQWGDGYETEGDVRRATRDEEEAP